MRRLLDEREIEEYADAGVNPILPASVEQSPIFTPQDTGTDVFSNLNAAGLKEETPSIIAPTVPATTETTTQTTSSKPSDSANLLTNFFSSDPNAASRLIASRTQAFDFGEGSTFNDPGETFGGFTVRAMPNAYDFEGRAIGTGYTASKSETGLNGKPIETVLSYDANGKITGSEVRVFTGGDSGLVYTLDAAGNILGQQEFDYSEGWKQAAAPLLQMAAIAAAPYLQGAGLFTKIGAGAAFSGANAALQGKEGSDLLKAAALGGASAGVGAGLGDTAGKYVGSLIEDPALSSIAKSAVAGGIKALPGAIATGDYGRALTGAVIGGGMQAADLATANIDLPFTRQQAEAGINLVRAVNSGNMVSAANSAAALINNPDITIATRAATLLKAMQSGNINAAMAAAQMLGNTIEKSSKTPVKTAEAPGGAFETSAIIDEFGDYGGTLVPGEAGESVNVFGTRTPEDISLDYFFSPEDTPVGQRVGVEGTRIKPDELGTFVDLFDKDLVDQRVDVTGSKIVPSLTGADLQTVGVSGTKFPVEGIEDVTDLESVLKEDPNKVTVTGRTIKPDDVTSQTVDVTSTKLPKEDVKETTTTTSTTTPTTIKPTTRVPTPTKKTTATPSAFTLISESAPQMPVRPGVVEDAYEVLFGAGAPSLMGFSKAERVKQILALKRQEEENEPDTPYDRLMAMAERDPVGTVDQLMKIIEGD